MSILIKKSAKDLLDNFSKKLWDEYNLKTGNILEKKTQYFLISNNKTHG